MLLWSHGVLLYHTITHTGKGNCCLCCGICCVCMSVCLHTHTPTPTSTAFQHTPNTRHTTTEHPQTNTQHHTNASTHAVVDIFCLMCCKGTEIVCMCVCVYNIYI